MIATPQQVNEALARLICQRREIDGQRFEIGKFVAIGEGRVIGSGDSFEEADKLLADSGAEPGEGMVCEVTEPFVDVIRCELSPWQ
jgi:hypothetical protein